MNIFKDYYKILGISPSATAQEIKNAYYSMSKKYHPDKNPDMDVTSIMQDINEAYMILKKPEKRSAYDREYKRFISNVYSEDKKETKNSTSYSYEYEVKDETLKKDIEFAREYAQKLVKDFLVSLKSTTQVAAKGAWEGVKMYVYVGIALSIIGGLISTCVKSSAQPFNSNLYTNQISIDNNSLKVYHGKSYSIHYPKEWRILENPDGISDVYIGSEYSPIGFTVISLNIEEDLETVWKESNNNANIVGMSIIEDVLIYIDNTRCHKTIYQFKANGALQTHISYLLKKGDIIYNIKFGGQDKTISATIDLINKLIKTFKAID